jgi:hypothetical protein
MGTVGYCSSRRPWEPNTHRAKRARRCVPLKQDYELVWGGSQVSS